jgi:hypothetical protein
VRSQARPGTVALWEADLFACAVPAGRPKRCSQVLAPDSRCSSSGTCTSRTVFGFVILDGQPPAGHRNSGIVPTSCTSEHGVGKSTFLEKPESDTHLGTHGRTTIAYSCASTNPPTRILVQHAHPADSLGRPSLRTVGTLHSTLDELCTIAAPARNESIKRARKAAGFSR